MGDGEGRSAEKGRRAMASGFWSFERFSANGYLSELTGSVRGEGPELLG